jgi:MoaA/NifB/PqqE/SkfB family radical SAM enzyme
MGVRDAARAVIRRHRRGLPDRLQALPVLVLFPHSRCNCRCVMCDMWRANRDQRELSVSELEPHLDGLRRLGVRWVVLSGGEPLMHSNLWQLCEQLEAVDVHVSLLSTGLLLERRSSEIVRWCDEVIVSLDGPGEIHDQIRRIPGAYDRLAAGVAAVRTADPGFPVSGRCVLQKRNFRALPEIIGTARAIGLDRISFLAADTSSTAFNRPVGWDESRVADVALNREEVVEAEQLVEAVTSACSVEFASGFVTESPERLRALVRYFAALNGDADFPANRCNAPWVSAVVEADGAVRPCFFHRILGNIHDAPLDEIVNSDGAVGFRRNLDVASDPICRRCVCTLWLEAGRLNLPGRGRAGR